MKRYCLGDFLKHLFVLSLGYLNIYSLNATTFTVDVPGDSNWSTGGTFSGTSGDLRGVLNHMFLNRGSHTVNFNLPVNNTILLNGILPVLSPVAASPDTIIIDGSNSPNSPIIIDGGNAHPGFIAVSGSITIQDIKIQNAKSLGGTGGTSKQGGGGSVLQKGSGGGGGAGLGGALLIDSASVVLSNVTFVNNQASGGVGGVGQSVGDIAGGGGGGGLAGGGVGGSSWTAFLGGGTGSGGGGAGLGGNGGDSGKNQSLSGLASGGGGGGISPNSTGGIGLFAPGGGGGNTGSGGNGGDNNNTVNQIPGYPGVSGTFGGGGGGGGGADFSPASNNNGGAGGNGSVGGTGFNSASYALGGGGGGGGSPGAPGSAGGNYTGTTTSGQGGTGGLGGGGGGSGVAYSAVSGVVIAPTGGTGGIGGGGGGGSIVYAGIGAAGGTSAYGGGGGGAGGSINNTPNPGGDGGFGGGGGGGGFAIAAGNGSIGGVGGYGGGGGGGGCSNNTGGVGGNGGFGGGGGGGAYVSGTPGAGGVGGGNGNPGGVGGSGTGGGGAGLGGAIFIKNTGQLVIQNNFSIVGNSVSGGSGANQGAAAASGVFIVSGATFTVDPSFGSTCIISDSIGDDSSFTLPGGTYTPGSGAGGSLNKTGLGTSIHSGTNTYTGVTTFGNGVLSVATIGNGSIAGNLGAATSAAANLVFDGGTLQYTGSTDSTNRNFTINNGKTATFDITANSLTISGATSATSGGLTKIGAGTLVMSGTNAYTGVTTFGNGVLSVATIGDGLVAGNLGAASSAADNLFFDGGTLQYTGSTDSTNRGFTINSGKTATFDITANSLTISGAASATSGGLTKIGAGTLVMSGTNAYAGVTTFGNGVLSVATIGDGLVAGNLGAASSAAGNLFFDGGTLQYTGLTDSTNRGFTINSGKTATFDITANSLTISGAALATSGGLTKIGAGTLVLSGTNPYSGGTIISQGTLSIDHSSAIGSESNTLAIQSGATFQTTTSFTSSRQTTLSGVGEFTGGIIDVVSSSELTYQGSSLLIGSGSLIKTSAGTLILDSTNTYTGGTYLKAGAITVTSDSSLGLVPTEGSSNYALTIYDGATLAVSNGSWSSLRKIHLQSGLERITIASGQYILRSGGSNNDIDGLGTLFLNGQGKCIFGAANTYLGDTLVESGTLQINNTSGSATGTGAVTVQNSATLSGLRAQGLITGNTGSISGQVSIENTGTLLTESGETLTLGSLIMSGGSTGTFNLGTWTTTPLVTVTGALNLTLGSSTINVVNTGAMEANIYTLFTYGSASNLGDFALASNHVDGFNLALDISTDHLVNLDVTDILNQWKKNVTNNWTTDANWWVPPHPAGVGAVARFLDNNGDPGFGSAETVNLNAPITVGTVVFNNETTAFTISGANALTLNNGAGDALIQVVSASSADHIIDVPLTIINNLSASIFSGSGAHGLTISGVISGVSQNLTKTGTGPLTLSGPSANTFNGITTVNAGELILAKNASGVFAIGSEELNILASAAATLNRSSQMPPTIALSVEGTFNLQNNTQTIGSISGLGSITTKSGGVLQIANGANCSFPGTIDGSGSIVKDGVGTLTLSGANTYDGGTTITLGTISIDAENRLGASSGAVTMNGGALYFSLGFTSSRTAILDNGGGTFTTNDNLVTWTGAIQSVGTGNFTKSGGGTLYLTHSNTYTGETHINAGTLRAGVTVNAFGNNSAVIMANELSALLDLNNLNNTIGSLQGGGPLGGNVNLGLATLTTGGNDSSTSYDGVISGIGGSLTKVGSGVMTLTNANTYTGGTIISQGTLSIDHSSAIGSESNTLAIQSGATFQTTASFITSRQTTLSGVGEFTGGVIDVASSSELTYQGSSTIIGSGSLVKKGAGTLVLDSVNTYAGGTYLKEGTAVITSDSSLGLVPTEGSSNYALTIYNGATLAVSDDLWDSLRKIHLESGTDTITIASEQYVLRSGGSNNDIDGSGALFLNGQGTFICGAANTYVGGTVVENGTLQINNTSGSATGSGAVTVQNSATLSGMRAQGLITGDTGSISGSVTIDNTGSLLTESGETLTLGSLSMIGGSKSTFNLGTWTTTPLVTVTGALSLPSGSSSINVVNAGTMEAHTYTLFSYGSASNLGNFTLASNHVGGFNLALNTSTNHFVNLDVTDILNQWKKNVTNDWTTDANWWDPPYPTGVGAVAQFLNNNGDPGFGSAETVNLNGPITVGTIVFNNETTAFTISSGSNGLTLNNGASDALIQVLSASTADHIIAVPLTLINNLSASIFSGSGVHGLTISGVISGIGQNLTKTGTGPLTLSGPSANTFNGITSVNAGELILAKSAPGVFAIGSGELDILINAAATMNRSSQMPSTTTLSVNGTFNLQNNTQTIGSISGLGSITTTSGGELQIANSANCSFPGTISGNGGIGKNGVGTLTLSGANSYSGGTTITLGTISVDAENQLGASSGAVTMNGGTLYFSSGFTSFRTAILGNSGGTFTTNNSLVTWTGAIQSVGAGNFTKSGEGTFDLTHANTYTGETHVDQGTLRLSNASALGSSPQITILSSGELSLNSPGFNITAPIAISGGRIRNVANTNTISGNISLSVADSFITVDADTLILSGIINGSTGITKDGVGIARLNNANTYTGATHINAGTLRAGVTTNAFGNHSAVIMANESSALLDLNNLSNTIGSLQGGDSSGGNVNLGIATLTTGGNNNSTSYGGVISGISGSLTKVGSGVMTLTNVNTFTGITTFENGVLSVATIGNGTVAGNLGAATSAAANLVFDGGTLQYTGSTDSTNRSFTINNGKTATFDITTYSLTISGAAIATTGGLTKIGAGTLVLSGSNAYSGATTVNAGVLRAGSTTNAFGNNSAITMANESGALLDLINLSNTIGSLQGGGPLGGDVTLGLATLTTGGNDNSTSYGGVISGFGGSLTKMGSGTMTLTNENTYFETTTISNGTLALSGAGSIISAVDLPNSGAIFDISAISATGISIRALNGVLGSSIILGAKNITVGSLNIADSYSGIISGSGGSFTKTGSGTMTLLGENTYSGTTTINNGTLALSGAGTIVGSVELLNSGAVFDISAISATGITIQALNGAFGSSIVLGAKNIKMGSLNTADTYFGVISGVGGSLTKTGSETLTLRSANTYTGQTTIHGGTLALSGSGSISSASPLDLTNSDSVFNISAISASSVTVGSLNGVLGSSIILGAKNITVGSLNIADNYSGNISGSGGTFTKIGSETMTLQGANTYTGLTTISAGTLIGNTTSLPGNILNQSFLVFHENGVGTYSGVLSGNGHLTSSGSGILTISSTGNVCGDVVAASGTLLVNGSLQGSGILTVNQGSILGGNGRIEKDVTVFGTLSPGNSIDSLQLVGNQVFASGSSFDVELTPSDIDLLTITGKLTIQTNTTLKLIPEPSSYNPTFFLTAIHTTGGISGKFTNVTNVYPTLIFFPLYSANDLIITFGMLNFSSLFPSGNAGAVAHCLDRFSLTTNRDMTMVINQLRLITSENELKSALLQLQPSLYTSLAIVQESNEQAMRNALFNQLEQSICMCDEKDYQMSIWAIPVGVWLSQSSENLEPGFQSQTYGILTGFDTKIGQKHFGLGLGYTQSDLDWRYERGSSDLQTIYAALYACHRPNYQNNRALYAFFEWALIGGYTFFDMDREIHFASINRHAQSSNRGISGSMHMKGELSKHFNHVRFAPFASFDGHYLHENRFTEKGAKSLDLLILSHDSVFLSCEAGIDISRCFSRENRFITPSIQLSAIKEYRFRGQHESSRFAFCNCCQMNVRGQFPSQMMGGLLAGLEAKLHRNITSSLFYRGKYGSDQMDHSLYFRAQLNW